MSWSLLSPDKPWCVYVIAEEGADTAGPSKVGTANVVAYRLSGMQSGNWRRLILHATGNCKGRREALTVERDVLAHFADRRLPGRDWIACPPAEVVAFLETHRLVTGGSYGSN